ncbi:hypothetical protein, partial [Xanthomonas maliensis]
MSVTEEDLKWRARGGARDVFGRRYSESQVMMQPGRRGEDTQGFPKVWYQNDAERSKQEICFLGGCVHWRNRPAERPSDALREGIYIYVITVDAKFYAIEQQPIDERELHHSTIPAGKGLICAGMLRVDVLHRLV